MPPAIRTGREPGGAAPQACDSDLAVSSCCFAGLKMRS
jgi:hypothetical protein